MKWDVYFEPRTPWTPIQLHRNMAGLIKTEALAEKPFSASSTPEENLAQG